VQRQIVADFELFVWAMAPRPPRATWFWHWPRPTRVFDISTSRKAGGVRRRKPRHRDKRRQRPDCLFIAATTICGMPDHLDSMVALLERADVGHSQTVEIDEYDRIHASGGGIGDPIVRKIMIEAPYYNTGLTTIGHTMAAYRRLPNGWPPALKIQRVTCICCAAFLGSKVCGSHMNCSRPTIRLGPFWGMTRFPIWSSRHRMPYARDHRIAA
jgi:hypothetical protein